MSAYSPSVVLTIVVSGGTSVPMVVPVTNIASRTTFDGPDGATYSWLLTKANGSPINGRVDQVGDRIITEEYPIRSDFLFQILNSDTDGTWTVEIFLWPPMV